MSDYKGKLLVLDDEVELRALLSNYLGSRGYLVRQAENARHLDTLLARESFDVLILDLMMPGEDGLSICKRLRLAGETIPILMLTARRETIDRIVGLEMGADDYLGKPFEPRELLARLDAMLRRQSILGAHHKQHAEACEGFGDYRLDYSGRRLFHGDRELPIHSAEFDLLQVLVANRGRPLSRERLLDLTRGRGANLTERSVDVQILRIRRLLEDDPSGSKYIVTVRGKGYMLADEIKP
ncbi:MAG: response regulator [Zhongshania sp.]|uniref:response regulator n=1 Tax=Zhongshania sp. TaxID=1971902 RepID=UPI0026174574|nr:response regulator [Zhongshania sp.]MDF1692235.1 response regulator [Zhongshania sp.]